MQVQFYRQIPDGAVRSCAVVAASRGDWVLFRRRGQDGYELPGGALTPGDDGAQAVREMLRQQIGAVRFTLRPLGYYGLQSEDNTGEECCGALFYAQIDAFGPLPPGIEKVELFEVLPENLKCPDLYPALCSRALRELSSL